MSFAIKRRENTFRIDYAGVPKKPSYEEVHHFVGTVLGLKREDVERIQCSRNLGCAFVKACDLATAQRVVDEHDKKHQMEVDGKVYTLRILLEDGTVEVKLHDLSEDVSNEQIAEFLCEYGDVYSIRELLWGDQYLFKGVPTGVRVAKMAIKKNIESYITIDGETTCVSYYGQRQTCRHCSEFVHNGISCVQNKKLLVQKSYANVAKQSVPNPIASNPPSVNRPLPKPSGSKTLGSKSTNPKPAKTPAIFNTPIFAANVREQITSNPTANSTSIKTKSHVFKPPSKPLTASKENLRKTGPSGKDDGDDSSASSISSRTRGSKKMRHDDSDDSHDEDPQLQSPSLATISPPSI